MAKRESSPAAVEQRLAYELARTSITILLLDQRISIRDKAKCLTEMIFAMASGDDDVDDFESLMMPPVSKVDEYDH